jgi:hypothetical protein
VNEFDGTKASQVVNAGKILNSFEDQNTVSVVINDPATIRQISYAVKVSSISEIFGVDKELQYIYIPNFNN